MIEMKNCTFHNSGQLSNRSIPAYIECGQCKKHSEIDASASQAKCPQCGSSDLARVDMGSGIPAWFKKGQA